MTTSPAQPGEELEGRPGVVTMNAMNTMNTVDNAVNVKRRRTMTPAPRTTPCQP